MSYIKSVDLICDDCGDSQDYPCEPTATGARRLARPDGWVYRGGRDLCPECRAETDHERRSGLANGGPA